MKDEITNFTQKLSSLLLQTTNQTLTHLKDLQSQQTLNVDKITNFTLEIRKLRSRLDQDLKDLREIQQEMRKMDRIESLTRALETLVPIANA